MFHLKSLINSERIKIEVGNMVYITVKLQWHIIFNSQNMLSQVNILYLLLFSINQYCHFNTVAYDCC